MRGASTEVRDMPAQDPAYRPTHPSIRPDTGADSQAAEACLRTAGSSAKANAWGTRAGREDGETIAYDSLGGGT